MHFQPWDYDLQCRGLILSNFELPKVDFESILRRIIKCEKMPINQIIDVVWLAFHNQTFSKLKSEFWPILAFKIPICKSQKIRILAQKHQSNHLLVFYINFSNTRLRFAMLWIIFSNFECPKVDFESNFEPTVISYWWKFEE